MESNNTYAIKEFITLFQFINSKFFNHLVTIVIMQDKVISTQFNTRKFGKLIIILKVT